MIKHAPDCACSKPDNGKPYFYACTCGADKPRPTTTPNTPIQIGMCACGEGPLTQDHLMECRRSQRRCRPGDCCWAGLLRQTSGSPWEDQLAFLGSHGLLSAAGAMVLRAYIAAQAARLAEVEGENRLMGANFESMMKAGIEQEGRAEAAEAKCRELEARLAECCPMCRGVGVIDAEEIELAEFSDALAETAAQAKEMGK